MELLVTSVAKSFFGKKQRIKGTNIEGRASGSGRVAGALEASGGAARSWYCRCCWIALSSWSSWSWPNGVKCPGSSIYGVAIAAVTAVSCSSNSGSQALRKGLLLERLNKLNL